MNISVDSGLKKKIQIENRKNRRGIYYLWLFEKISFACIIIAMIIEIWLENYYSLIMVIPLLYLINIRKHL